MLSSTLLFALASLIATATAVAIDPPSVTADSTKTVASWRSFDREASSADREASSSDREASADREASDSTDRESRGESKSSKIFEKLGFCNDRTLKGRYTFFDNGFANVGGEVGGSPTTGPVAGSGSVYYGGNGQSFRRVVFRSDTGPTALGVPTVFNLWASVDVFKNCTVVEQGVVVELVSPIHIIGPATTLFYEGNVSPDGGNNVFTEFNTAGVNAFSGDIKRVAKFALPPREFIEGPPDIPGCDADQSCVKQFEGENCNTDSDCLTGCFPLCDMACVRIGLQGRKCVRQE